MAAWSASGLGCEKGKRAAGATARAGMSHRYLLGVELPVEPVETGSSGREPRTGPKLSNYRWLWAGDDGSMPRQLTDEVLVRINDRFGSKLTNGCPLCSVKEWTLVRNAIVVLSGFAALVLICRNCGCLQLMDAESAGVTVDELPGRP